MSDDAPDHRVRNRVLMGLGAFAALSYLSIPPETRARMRAEAEARRERRKPLVWAIGLVAALLAVLVYSTS